MSKLMNQRFRTADELRAAGANLSTMIEESDAVWKAMSDIADAANAEKRSLQAGEARAYDALERVFTGLSNAINEEQHMIPQRALAVAPSAGSRQRPDTLLQPSDRFADWPSNRANASDHYDAETPRFGAMIRAMVTGRQDGMTPAEIKALSEGTSSAGGAFVPTPTSAQFIDRVRNVGRVFQAGATTVPMDSQTLKVPRLTGSSGPAWRSENAAIAVGDMTFDAVTLTAQSLAFMVKMSRELIEDAKTPDLVRVVEGEMASQVALEIDRVALRGSGVAPEPRGLRNTTGVTITPFGGANGAAPTNYDHLIDAVQTVRGNNFEPTAVIQSPRSETTLAKLKETTTGAYLAPPAVLADIPRLRTNQVPGNLTTGTSADTSEIYTGQWPLLYVGIRTGPLSITLDQRFFDLGQIALVIWFRGDVAAAQPGAFNVVTGVRP